MTEWSESAQSDPLSEVLGLLQGLPRVQESEHEYMRYDVPERRVAGIYHLLTQTSLSDMLMTPGTVAQEFFINSEIPQLDKLIVRAFPDMMIFMFKPHDSEVTITLGYHYEFKYHSANLLVAIGTSPSRDGRTLLVSRASWADTFAGTFNTFLEDEERLAALEDVDSLQGLARELLRVKDVN